MKRELTINGKAILRNADQKISAEQFEKTALDVIIRRIWKDEEAETQSLLYINATFWQLDLFEFLQIKSTFQALKMDELMALPMRGHYYLPEAVYLNKWWALLSIWQNSAAWDRVVSILSMPM